MHESLLQYIHRAYSEQTFVATERLKNLLKCPLAIAMTFCD